MATGFIEKRLLDCVSYNTSFGLEFRTEIVEIVSGHERRGALWDMPRGKYTVDYATLTPTEGKALRDAFIACRGSLTAFRFKDWADYKVTKAPIGITQEGVNTFQLTQSHGFGGEELKRIIRKPVVGTVQVFIDDEPVAFTLDYTTGLITLTAATSGGVVTWSGEFDVPVRFMHDTMDFVAGVNRASGMYAATGAELIEVRL